MSLPVVHDPRVSMTNQGHITAPALTPSTFMDTSAAGVLSSLWIGSNGGLKVSAVTQFGVSNLFITTTVTLQNTGSTIMTNVFYMRTIDPNQEAVSA